MIHSGTNWTIMVKSGPNGQKLSKWSNIVKRSNMVQYDPKWSFMVQIDLEIFSYKITAVCATAVGLTAVSNNLKFLTIINVGTTIIL